MEFWTRVFSNSSTQNSLEKDTIKGDSPVEEDEKRNGEYPEYYSLDFE